MPISLRKGVEFIKLWNELKTKEEKVIFLEASKRKHYSVLDISFFTGWSEYDVWCAINTRLIRIAPGFSCYFWAGITDKNLNAVIQIHGKKMLVHEYIWKMLQHKEIPKGYCLIRACDTPDCVFDQHFKLIEK